MILSVHGCKENGEVLRQPQLGTGMKASQRHGADSAGSSQSSSVVSPVPAVLRFHPQPVMAWR